jgi:2-polyprenyl-6-methoxyphenol hydroxylase-like FAD-dependent oxidoreductase
LFDEPPRRFAMNEIMNTRCCIVGGGPAGMMLGFLLARAGVDVVVMEKHADFFRDFRGDTIHPSTLELIYELGLLDEFLKLPHQVAPTLGAKFGDLELTFVDFGHLPVHCKYIALMPQWDFLNFLAEHGRRYPGFRLLMQAEVTGLIEEQDRVVGVHANVPGGSLEVRSALVVGCDGRHSTVREKARLPVEELGAPMDVLWFRISRRPDDPSESTGRFEAGRIFIMINRGDYWQCGYVIAKGTIEEIHRKGLNDFQRAVAEAVPLFEQRVREIADWDQVKLLTVAVDRLERWHRSGVICIGDAAHAMSPIGGVGVNLAVQDAVAAANILAEPLYAGNLDESVLHDVQERRALPTRIIQRLQVFLQDRVIKHVLGGNARLKPPLPLTLMHRFPVLRRIPAWLIGMGVRPEHIRTPVRPNAGGGAQAA